MKIANNIPRIAYSDNKHTHMPYLTRGVGWRWAGLWAKYTRTTHMHVFRVYCSEINLI